MNKITLGFFYTKFKTTVNVLVLFFVFLFMNSQASWGQQLLQWNTVANLGTETTEPSIANDVNIASANLTQGTITAASNGNRFGGSGWFNTGNTAAGNTLSEAVAGNDYIQFVVTPNAGFTFTPTSFVFRWDRSGTGPSNVTLRSSIDNYASDIGSVTGMVSGGVATTTDRTITISGIVNISSATTFRIYGYGSTANTGTGGFDCATGSITANVVLNGTTAVIWDGFNWSNTTGPDENINAVINGTYNTNVGGNQASFTTKSLTVTSLGSLTINSGTNITVQNEVINNGSLIVENDANLIQVNNTTNTGNAVVKRNSNPLSRLDYTLWSSPVANQNLLAFSPLTSNTSLVTTPITTVNRFYTYDSATNFYVAIPDPAFATTAFAKGTGYLIRMPNTAVAAPGSETFNGVFTGVLNNGDINLTGLTAGQYVAVGNPYPSSIKAIDFLNANLDSGGNGTIYLWRKKNGEAIVTSAYATMNKTGSTSIGLSTGDGGIFPNGYIAVGQGFITTVPPSGTITFNNTMRSTNTATFLRTKAAAQIDRVWINLTNTDGAFSQMLVGYMDGATTGFDAGIDGKYINDAPTALTSDIAGEEYVIQGRPTFSDTDVVNLNFKASAAGTHTIAKDHVDGLFATGQDIYLVDKTTGAETNLKKEAYTFTAAAGVNNTRFQLTYKTSGSLKVNSNVFDENSISVYKQNGVLNINAGNTTMKSVKVFDVTGRLILEQKAVNATTTTLKNLAVGKQALLIQITSDDNRVVTKKAIN